MLCGNLLCFLYLIAPPVHHGRGVEAIRCKWGMVVQTFLKNQSKVLQILAFCGVLLSLIKIAKFTLDFKVSHRYNNPRTERWQSGNAADC